MLANIVAWWIIVATNECATMVATELSTPQTSRVPPNHMSVMATLLSGSTTVGIVTPHPLTTSLLQCRRGRRYSKQRSRHKAPGSAPCCSHLGVDWRSFARRQHGVVPNQRSDSYSGVGLVVDVVVVLLGVFGMGGLEH